MRTSKELSDLRVMLDQFPILKQATTAELADENLPDGEVVLRDVNGVVVARMPREVYDDIRSHKM